MLAEPSDHRRVQTDSDDEVFDDEDFDENSDLDEDEEEDDEDGDEDEEEEETWQVGARRDFSLRALTCVG